MWKVLINFSQNKNEKVFQLRLVPNKKWTEGREITNVKEMQYPKVDYNFTSFDWKFPRLADLLKDSETATLNEQAEDRNT